MTDDAELYRQIEQRYEFALPREYREMQYVGWFGPTDAAAARNLYPQPYRIAYVWLNEMEWMPLADILRFQFGGNWKPGFVPFAFTGGGDYWCWYPRYADEGVTPVVMCPRDSRIGNVYAREFVSALYRQILDFARYWTHKQETARNHLTCWLDTFGLYFQPEWRRTIADLRERPVQSWHVGKTKMYGLLLPEEYDAIVDRDLAFPRLDEPFEWMED